MRLDKYLKVSRLIKRRTLAKEASTKEKVLVNNQVAKPSKEIKIGDIITLHFGRKIIELKVISLFSSIKKDEAALMYELISEKNQE